MCKWVVFQFLRNLPPPLLKVEGACFSETLATQSISTQCITQNSITFSILLMTFKTLVFLQPQNTVYLKMHLKYFGLKNESHNITWQLFLLSFCNIHNRLYHTTFQYEIRPQKYGRPSFNDDGTIMIYKSKFMLNFQMVLRNPVCLLQ
jgi:hypothetical protein